MKIERPTEDAALERCGDVRPTGKPEVKIPIVKLYNRLLKLERSGAATGEERGALHTFWANGAISLAQFEKVRGVLGPFVLRERGVK